MSTFFAYEPLAQELGIDPKRLCILADAVRDSYGGDEMLAELRLLRTLRAIQEGATTLDQAIAEYTSQPEDATAPP